LSWPDLFRPSTSYHATPPMNVDARDKPGHNDTANLSYVIARSVSSEAIQSLLRGFLDCFASLAMTGN